MLRYFCRRVLARYVENAANILYKQTRGVVKALREILKWSGFKVVKTIERGGTGKHPEVTAAEILRCKKAVRKSLLRVLEGGGKREQTFFFMRYLPVT